MSKRIQSAFYEKEKRGGFSAKTVIIPAVVVMLCLHALIMVNMIRINNYGAQVSETMQFNFSYLQISKEYENNSEMLASKAKLYTSTGDASYLDDYFYILREMQAQGETMRKMLRSSEDSSAYEEISSALRDFEPRVQTELRAIRLCTDVFDLELDNYPQLAEVTLTEEDRSLSSPQKWTDAMALLASADYQKSVALVHEYIGRAIRSVATDTAQKVGQQSAALGKARTLQWVMTVVCIVVLNLMIVLLFLMLLSPLEQSVEKVSQGEVLPADRGASEFRRLAVSYNELLRHKRRTESYLRKQSQTDALTSLSNRMAFQDFISQLSWDHADSAVTVFSLDVNGLKEANDKHGHSHGDELLRKCAACILSTFGDEPGKRCFRFGGDEFAAIWVNVPRDRIEPALERFEKSKAEYGVSISVGYAFTEELGQTTMEALFEQADQYMYQDKARYHKEAGAVQ